MGKFLRVVTMLSLGTLITTAANAADLNVTCYRGSVVSAKSDLILSFAVAPAPSNRLVSDIQETFPKLAPATYASFLVAQYKFKPIELFLQIDDGSAEGVKLAELQTYSLGGKLRGELARYHGVYKRMSAGKATSLIVTCIVK